MNVNYSHNLKNSIYMIHYATKVKELIVKIYRTCKCVLICLSLLS